MLRLSKKKICLYFWSVLTLSYTFYAKFLVYKFNIDTWLSMTCKNEGECSRILLVADPQIIGNLEEVFHSVTPFSILDSDRYLKITYYHAYHFVKPHVVIFLGDLMDEAHIASDKDFYAYVRRIFEIFLSPYSNSQNVKHIWLPGDNDIGGEDTKVTPKKLQRFERAFSQSSIHNVNNITFFEINRITEIIPVYKKEREFYDVSKIFAGVSQVPLMFRPSPFTEKSHKYKYTIEPGHSIKGRAQIEYFNANTSFKYIEITFNHKTNTKEQPIKQSSIWAIVFILVLLMLAYNIQTVLELLKQHLNFNTDKLSSFIPIPSNSRSMTDYDNDIDQIAHDINNLKKNRQKKSN